MVAISGIAHVELSVSDLDRSVAWYSELLSAPETFRAADESEGIVAAAIRDPASNVVLAFTQHDRQEPGRFTPRRAGLDHLCFGVASEEALEDWVARLDQFGIEHSPIRDYGFGLAVTFDDPDGIALEILFPNTRSRSDG
jgi:glyoxylase I family protein